MCTDRLAAQSDTSPDAVWPRGGRPKHLQGANVFYFGPHEATAAITQRVFGVPDTVLERLGVVDELLGPVTKKRVHVQQANVLAHSRRQ